MGKATKAVKRRKSLCKKSPFPIGPDARWFLEKIKEARRRLMMCTFEAPDAKRTPAQEKKRNTHRDKSDSARSELRELGDAVAARFSMDPQAVTLEDVLTLALAAYHSKAAQNEMCHAVVTLSGLRWPGL